MVEVLNTKPVIYESKPCTAELCVHTTLETIGQPFAGGRSGMRTSDKDAVAMYQKKGIKFSGENYYFVRILNRKGVCAIVLKTHKKLLSAKKQFNLLTNEKRRDTKTK